jgi:hypothetical protein
MFLLTGIMISSVWNHYIFKTKHQNLEANPFLPLFFNEVIQRAETFNLNIKNVEIVYFDAVNIINGDYYGSSLFSVGR